MTALKSIREMFSGGQDSNPTIQDLAKDHITEGEVLPPENPMFTARMPGDDLASHPLVQSQLNNPFYGINPQRVSTLLRAGKLTPAQERQARGWIDQYQKLTGETLYNGRNHDFEEPEVTGDNCCGLRRADPYQTNNKLG